MEGILSKRRGDPYMTAGPPHGEDQSLSGKSRDRRIRCPRARARDRRLAGGTLAADGHMPEKGYRFARRIAVDCVVDGQLLVGRRTEAFAEPDKGAGARSAG